MWDTGGSGRCCKHKFHTGQFFMGNKHLWYPWLRPLCGCDLTENLEIFIPHVYSTPPLFVGAPSKFRKDVYRPELGMIRLCWRKYDAILNRLDTTPERDRRTDRHKELIIIINPTISNAPWHGAKPFTLCTRLRTVYTASVSVSCLSVSVTVREQMSLKSGFDDDHGDDEEAVQILKSRVSMPTRDKKSLHISSKQRVLLYDGVKVPTLLDTFSHNI